MLIKASYACYYAEIAILVGLLLYKFVWWDVRFYYFVGLLVLYIGVGLFHYILVYWKTYKAKKIEIHKMKKFPRVFFLMPFLLILSIGIYEFFTSPLTDICESGAGIDKKVDFSRARLLRTVRLSNSEDLYFYEVAAQGKKLEEATYNEIEHYLVYENKKTNQKWNFETSWFDFKVGKGLFGGYSISYRNKYTSLHKWEGFLHIKNGEITEWCYET